MNYKGNSNNKIMLTIPIIHVSKFSAIIIIIILYYLCAASTAVIQIQIIYSMNTVAQISSFTE
jgi:hypothetical protein